VTTWDGRGLPPVAQARAERFRSSPMRTSLLSVPAAASLESVGFDTVGEVMGCIVERISWATYAGCGLPYGGGYGSAGYAGGMFSGGGAPVQSATSRFSGYGPYVSALNTGYDTALHRMLLEAASLGADGVVGVRLTVERLQGEAREFMALGTAVRARSDTRPAAPFSTELPGTDFAKLVMSGWIPVALQYGLEVAIRHDDYQTRAQAGSGLFNTRNVEVSGYTELVQHTRAAARDKLARKIATAGADGGVISGMSLKMWEIEPSDGHTDHVAEAMVTGTAIAAFGRTASFRAAAGAGTRAGTLTILPTRPTR